MGKRSAIEISIAEPCSQDWNGMHSNESGKFCDHCQKNVVDFSGMSDAALLAYVEKFGLGCGNFREDQLNRVLLPVVISKTKFWQQILLSVGLFLGIAKDVNAQKQAHVKMAIAKDSSQRANVFATTEDEKSISAITVEGVLTDQQGNFISGGNVILRDTKTGVIIAQAITDFDGYYKVKIEGGTHYKQKVLVLFKSMDDEKKQIVTLKHFRNVINFTLTLSMAKLKPLRLIRGGAIPIQRSNSMGKCTK